MALSKYSVKKAKLIFSTINGMSQHTPIFQRDEDNQYLTRCFLGISEKADGGWESVFINIKNIEPWQVDFWETKKRSIPNSSALHEVQPGITRLSFY